MALRPGGPLGDMQSQNEYASERLKQGQQSARPAPQEAPAQKQDIQQSILAENERNAARNAAERSSKLSPAQPAQAQQEMAEAKQAALQQAVKNFAPTPIQPQPFGAMTKQAERG